MDTAFSADIAQQAILEIFFDAQMPSIADAVMQGQSLDSEPDNHPSRHTPVKEQESVMDVLFGTYTPDRNSLSQELEEFWAQKEAQEPDLGRG